MTDKLLSLVNNWGPVYGFTLAVLFAIVSLVILYTLMRITRRTKEDTQKNFRLLKSSLDDRDISTREINQKMIAMLNSLRGALKQEDQWDAIDKNTQEQLEKLEQLLAAVEESTKVIKNTIAEQEIYLHDSFAALSNNDKDANMLAPETMSEITQKITQTEERLEDIINKRLSILDYIEGMDEKIPSLTISRMEESINPKITQLEERLEDMINKRLSSLEYMEGLDEKISSLTISRMKENINPQITQLEERLEERLENIIDKRLSGLEYMKGLDEKISSLSDVQSEMDKINKNVTQLSLILSASSSGATEILARERLGNLLAQSLPADCYQLEFSLQNGGIASALLRLPEPSSAVVIDAELSLDSFFQSLDSEADNSIRAQAREDFHKTTVEHINFVADNLITPPETGDSAFLFVPTEAAFAEIQAHHREAVELAIQRRVWLVSPTTVIAIINTARAAVRDHQAQQQLEKMHETAADILKEAQVFENRIVEIGDHVNSAWRSVQRAETAGSRLLGRVREASSIDIKKDGS